MCFHNHPSVQILFVSPVRTLACLTIALMISTRGASAQCPPPATAFVENQVAASGRNATVGFRDCGEFIIAWETPVVGFPGENDIFVQRFNPDGVPLGTTFPVSANPEPGSSAHHRASLAMSPLGHVSMAWTGVTHSISVSDDAVLDISFDFDNVGSIVPVIPPAPPGGTLDFFASVGTSDVAGAGGNLFAMSWSSVRGPGLFYQALPTSDQIRTCSTFCVNRISQWRSCVSMRPSDGFVAVAWADAELDLANPPFNVALRVYNTSGVLVAQRDGPDINDPSKWVNDPLLEDPAPGPKAFPSTPPASPPSPSSPAK